MWMYGNKFQHELLCFNVVASLIINVNLNIQSQMNEEWWINEIFGGTTNFFNLNNKKRQIHDAYEEFIIDFIQSGCLDDIYFDESESEIDLNKRYGRTLKRNYWRETNWGQLYINNPEVKDPSTKTARDFRRRFRVPFPIFDEIIVPECDRLNVFEVRDLARVRIPTDFKVLICLRILGRGTYQDDIAEMSGSFKSTCNKVFRQFLRNFTPAFYSKFVVPPTGMKRKKIMDTYAKIGLHGCMGSMDATHVFWARCPENMHNLCIGKEKKPSVAWNCVVDHAYGIHHVSDLIFGATNDMTLARNDAYPMKFSNGGFEKIKFEILIGRGLVQVCYGAYLITDTGYLKQNCFVCPMPNRVDRQAVIFSEFVESTRKDVECTFGQLKNRFRIIKRPLEMESLHEINLLFKACCVLHNMILIYDHRDIMHWEVGVDWALLNPDDDEPDHVIEGDYLVDEEPPEAIFHPDLPQFVVQPGPRLHLKALDDHQKLLNKLCVSFKYQYEMGLISWPRSFSTVQKRQMPCHRIAMIANRAEREIYDSLIVGPSILKGMDSEGNFTMDLQNGLFAGVNYRPGNKIVKFKDGERISKLELLRREECGKGGYALHINAMDAMDLYDIRHMCKASMANDPTNAWNTKTNCLAKENSELRSHVTKMKCSFFLEAIAIINVGDEITFRYSPKDEKSTYRFPSI